MIRSPGHMPPPRSSREELRVLIARSQSGDRDATAQLVAENTALVMSIAKRYATVEHPLADVAQIGSLGLIEAIKRFDPSRGIAFSTYAYQWVRQAINRGLPHEELIRYPADVWWDRHKLFQIAQELEREIGRPPSELWLARESGMTLARTRRLLGAARISMSLDETIGADPEDTLQDLISDGCDLEALAERDDLRQKLEALLATLPLVEERTIRLRFGFDDGLARTYGQIAKLEGVSRAAIGQRIQRALRRLADRLTSEDTDGTPLGP